ncbi:MAG TPA: hypothetical protein VM166_02290, partial [Gemmatimonadaceae bacterium]|nr:hypothetical protein [Gemmatimonadaceae bacterium]
SVEFIGTAGEPISSGRESTQPNRTDLEYWAQGLTKVYLQGALARAVSLARRETSVSASKPTPPPNHV